MNELEKKEKMLRDFLNREGYDGALLFRRDTFSWITGGKINHIIRPTEYGMVALYITEDKKFCIANQVESARIMEEELSGLGYELLEINWWEEDYVECVLRNFGAVKIASDKDDPNVSNEYESLKKLRFTLFPEEIERYKELSLVCTDIVEKTCMEIRPDCSEYDVCASLVAKAVRQGIEASVALVASDARIFKYRHPIDTDKKIDKYAMVVLCGRKHGLFANLTRFVHFGNPPEEIVRKFELVRKIDAEIIVNTVVGRNIADIFKIIMKEYEEAGYKDEWKLLHQGGPTGYATRDFLATPFYNETVRDNQAFTWNPSITGTKSEDTVLVNNEGFHVLTNSHKWPSVEIQTKSGIIVNRPDTLIL